MNPHQQISELNADVARFSDCPKSVQRYNLRREHGYAVVAASNIGNGDCVGFYGELANARDRATAVKGDASKWISGIVGTVTIYNTHTLRIVERY